MTLILSSAADAYVESYESISALLEITAKSDSLLASIQKRDESFQKIFDIAPIDGPSCTESDAVKWIKTVERII